MKSVPVFAKPPGPHSPEAEHAMKYCREQLGWKDAYIPSVIALRDVPYLQPGIVYRSRPIDIFDTPEEFYFTKVVVGPNG
jgi:hypothetical protein